MHVHVMKKSNNSHWDVCVNTIPSYLQSYSMPCSVLQRIALLRMDSLKLCQISAQGDSKSEGLQHTFNSFFAIIFIFIKRLCHTKPTKAG